jgi:Kef-type K+ transport system membrane component KefB
MCFVGLELHVEDLRARSAPPSRSGRGALTPAAAAFEDVVGWGLLAAITALVQASTGIPAREAWAIGFLMNTRGQMELVAADIGLDLGIIPASVFFILIFMALVTTYMTPPLVRRVLRPTLTTA